MATLDEKLARGAYVATIVAAVVAILTLCSGFVVFQRSTALQQEVSAIGLFRDYIGVQAQLAETMIGLEPFEAPCASDAKNLSDFKIWKCSYGLFVGESIFTLCGGDETWLGTVKSIILHHAGFIRNAGLPCKEYDKAFIDLVKEVVPNFKCTS